MRCVEMSAQVVCAGWIGGLCSTHFFAHKATPSQSSPRWAGAGRTLILTPSCPSPADQSAFEQIFQLELGEYEEGYFGGKSLTASA